MAVLYTFISSQSGIGVVNLPCLLPHSMPECVFVCTLLSMCAQL